MQFLFFGAKIGFFMLFSWLFYFYNHFLYFYDYGSMIWIIKVENKNKMALIGITQ